MFSTQCPQCDAVVPLLGRVCGHCGAPNPARRGMIAVAAAVVVLIGAGAGGIYMATRQQHPPTAATAGTSVSPSAAGTSAGPSAAGTSVGPSATTAPGDFTWLSTAMTACDEAAAKQPNKMHFLMIPLIANPKDMADWRLIAGSPIGNALTIPANDALGGLKRGTLKIYPDEYVFSVQDEATKAVYKWNPASGVKWFSTTDDPKIGSFRVQFQPRRKPDGDWGALYSERGGMCLWVAAIVRDGPVSAEK